MLLYNIGTYWIYSIQHYFYWKNYYYFFLSSISISNQKQCVKIYENYLNKYSHTRWISPKSTTNYIIYLAAKHKTWFLIYYKFIVLNAYKHTYTKTYYRYIYLLHSTTATENIKSINWNIILFMINIIAHYGK